MQCDRTKAAKPLPALHPEELRNKTTTRSMRSAWWWSRQLILDRNKGDFNEAPISYLAGMAGEAIPPLANATKREIWEDMKVLLFLQTHKYGSGLCVLTRDIIYRRARSYC